MAGKKSFQPYRNSKTGIRHLFPGGENFGDGSFDKTLRMHHGQLDVAKFETTIYHINETKVLNGKVINNRELGQKKAFPVNFFEN